MSGRVKIKIKDKKPKIDVFKVIENRFKNMNELRDLIDMVNMIIVLSQRYENLRIKPEGSQK